MDDIKYAPCISGYDPIMCEIIRAFNLPEHLHAFEIECAGPDELLTIECTYTPEKNDVDMGKITQKFNLVLPQDWLSTD